MNQVFITGMGMLSPLGKNRKDSFAAALLARSAIERAPEALSAGLANILMAPAAVEPGALLDSQDAGLDRATQFSLVAAQEAMADAGIDQTPSDAGRFGVSSGSDSAAPTRWTRCLRVITRRCSAASRAVSAPPWCTPCPCRA